MDKGKVNFIIDAAMALCISAVAGLGLLMKFVLIPGKDRVAVYGRSVELYLLGMDRHQWGTIHLYLSLFLLALLVLHIILHWSLVKGLYRRVVPVAYARRLIAGVFSILVILLISFSAFVKPKIEERGGYRGGSGQSREVRQEKGFENKR